ncbi:hypothetical protein KL930_004972 [Ogataea haglerorum]|nr:hypothetical protein KL915_004770 [Ogataea haglerorum]KAG7699863.1 hypothetical protein KL951_001580 [Ogataea haglerorum]KAG7703140.1 hypothetical protein KL914_004921 [Ogataea haglerorum]KAG7703263.1 hypothetical protein KL950_004897 [Ogataea haglerorum]KAG7714739.1 hypothetical protein KL949_004575 [Ogataea haglerorum]
MDATIENTEFLDFLNTTQSGAAHNSVGISFESFLSSLIFSLVYCSLQVLIFTYLRTRFKEFYQPLCYCLPESIRTPPLSDHLLAWAKPIVYTPIGTFYRLGLDSYYFLRFMYTLLILFVGMACLNIPVLIPVNFCGGDELTKGIVRGLDRISTSNISSRNTNKYMFHFGMAIFVILWFHYVLIYEMKSCVEERQKHLVLSSKVQYKRASLSTVLLENIPHDLMDESAIEQFFATLPGGVKKVWPILDYRNVEALVQKYEKYRSLLEELELNIIKDKTQNRVNHATKYFYEPFELFGFECTVPGICKVVDPYDHTAGQMLLLGELILAKQRELKSVKLRSSKINKAFVQFNKISTAYLARQLLLTRNPKGMTVTLMEMTPDDVIWKNIVRSDQTASNVIWNAAMFFVSILIIVCWVVPVAFVGSISQLPYLTALIPTISWLNGLPDFLTAFIAGILPTIVLTLLTSVALQIFKVVGCKRGKIVGSSLELSLQSWVFVFLFFHLFIVITISSGFIVVLERFLLNPSAIPAMVAQDFPKASNFFFSFFILKGLTCFGNSLLQFGRFSSDLCMDKLIDKTPREKLHRRMSIPQPSWGLTYPTYSVYGSIGLVYSVISPLILVFCCINFLLDLLSYKYCLLYVYNYKNSSETGGKIYSIALRQLYAGVYSLEVFLIGLFFIVKDDKGENTCFLLGIMMVIVLVLTICVHISINNQYDKSLSVVPLELFEELDREIKFEHDFDTASIFCHPSLRFDPRKQVVWIPKDPHGHSDRERQKLELLGLKVFDQGCTISSRGRLEILMSPPDYVF